MNNASDDVRERRKIMCGLQERGTWQGDLAMSKHRILENTDFDGVWFSFGTF